MEILAYLGVGAFILLLLVGWFCFCKDHPIIGMLLALLMLGE